LVGLGYALDHRKCWRTALNRQWKLDTTCSNFGCTQVNESTVAKPEDAITPREMSK
jgi:type IV pilus biogenesis protein CpaD/CtpE